MQTTLTEKETETLRQILSEELGAEASQLEPEARLVQDLGADSLTMVQILMAVEDEFHVTVPDEQWEHVATVGDVFEHLEKLLADRG